VSSDVVGELGECVCVVPCWMSDVSCPLRRRGSPSFYRPRMGRITGMPHCLATWGSMAGNAAELAAVLTVLATILSSWRVLYPNCGSFEGRGVVVDRGVFRRARGSRWRRSVRDTVAGVAASRPRAPDRAGVVVTAPGVVLQAQGRPHRTNSGGDGVPPA
jgi:hypothetical protein